MTQSKKKIQDKINAILASDLVGKDMERAISEVLKPADDSYTPEKIYFKKYYLKITFVVFIFIMIGGLAWYSLDAIFNSNEVPKEGVAIVNLILGTLLGKSSDLFELIRNGQGKE
jgi:hypothetical protein